jgi:hypothetical protein
VCFGFWPGKVNFSAHKIMENTVYLVGGDGNHENHDKIGELLKTNGKERKPIEILPNILYCPRGSVIKASCWSILYIRLVVLGRWIGF